MLQSLQKLLLPATISLIILLAGCAKPPQAELAAARQAVARAYAAGAMDLAGDDYQAARAALRNAERLSDRGEYKAARDILSTAEAQAKLAAAKAREKRARIERERLKKKQHEELRRRRELAARKKQHRQAAKAKPKPKPKPPAPVNRYTVKAGETLWQIAARPEVYNDELLWPLLYKSNRDQITDPRKIYAGQELIVPRKLTTDDKNAARAEARTSGIYPLLGKPVPTN